MKLFLIGAPLSGIFRVSQELEKRLALTEPADMRDYTDEFMRRLRSADFPDGTVLAGHFRFDADVARQLAEQGFVILTLLRNPYSNLQALYQQAQTEVGVPSDDECNAIKGLMLDSPEMAEFTRTRYGDHIEALGKWLSFSESYALNVEYFDKAPDRVAQLIEAINTSHVEESDVLPEHRRLGSEVRDVNNWSHLEAHRLPLSLVAEVNRRLPDSYKNQGYLYRSEEPGAELSAVMSGFAQYLQDLPKKRHVFIVGNGKSGTTWLHLAFFRHPNVVSLAERRLYEHPDGNVGLFDQWLDKNAQNSWFTASSFGKRYPESQHIFTELKRVVSDYMAYRDLSMIVGEDGFNRDAAITHIVEKIALTSGDDARSVMRGLAATYPDALVVHIVRDPRDVAISNLFHVYRDRKKSGDMIDWMAKLAEPEAGSSALGAIEKHRFRAFCKDRARAWNDVVSAFHSDGQSFFDDRYLLLKYEDMLEDPVLALQSVFSHAGLENDAAVVEQVVAKTSFQSITKGRSSGQQDSSSFFRKGVAGDWQNYVTEDQWRDWFSSCIEQMTELGYK